MRSFIEKIIIIIIAIIAAFLSSRLQEGKDFLWSLRVAVIPVMVTMLTLYTTLSMNLLKALDDLPSHFREKAVTVVDSMKFEIRLELILLIISFFLLIIQPLLEGCLIVEKISRCVIDGLIVVDISFFIIAIIDTYFALLDLIKAK